MDKIGKNYLDIYNSLADRIHRNPGISISELFQQFSMYDKEILHECMTHMLSQNYIEIIEPNRRFEKIKIKIIQVPEIKINEKKEQKYPKLLITLPPFNVFGLESELRNSNISFFDLKSEFEKLFQKSKEDIYICSPFIELRGIQSFLPLLVSKAKKGICIKIISREIESSNSKYLEIKKIFEYFKERDVEVEIRDYHYKSNNKIDSSIHAKLIISDNKYAYIGSGELRKNSFEKNFEVGMLLNGKKARDIGLIFEKVFSVSKKVKFD